MTPRGEGLYQLKCPRHPHPALGFAPPVGLATAWWHPKAAGTLHLWEQEGQEFGAMSPTLGPRALGMGKGHGCTGWAAHPLGTSTPQIPAPATPLQLCSAPWGGRAHGGHSGRRGGRVAAAHPQQAPLPAAAATLLFCPEPAQTTSPVVVGAAGRSWHCQRSRSPETPHSPPVPGWDRCPLLKHQPGTDPRRCRGPSLGHRAPRGCWWHTRGSSTWSIPVPVPWPRCPALELHHGLPCVLESST